MGHDSDTYRRLFAALPSPHLVVTPDLVVVDATDTYLDMVGVDRTALVGRPVFEVFPPTDDAVDEAGEPRLVRSFRRVIETGRPDPSFVERYDVVDPASGGAEERWWSHVVVPVLDERGAVELLVQRVDEVTDYVHEHERVQDRHEDGGEWRSRAEQMQAELYARSREVQAAREAELRTSRVIEAMPSGFLSLDAEWRFVVLNAAAERLLGTTRAQLLGRTLWEAFPDTVGNEFEHTYRAAIETGVPQTVEAYYPAPLDAWFEVLAWPTADGLSLYFSDITDRRWTAERAEWSARRLALLARVADELATTTDLAATVAAVPRTLVPELGEGAVITMLDATGRPGEVSWWHADVGGRTHLPPVPMLTLAEVIENGSPLLAPGTPAGARHEPDTGRAGGAWTVVLPIRGRDATLGALTLFGTHGAPAAGEVRATAQDVADRIGLAVDNARLVTAQVQLAEGLQRSLLTEPPEPDHAQVVVRYLPAAEAAQVGGDWYDAFLQHSGSTIIVIGDVAGHDTAAAAAMGQLRGLLRGIATYSGAGPTEVLRGLDTAMELLMLRTLVTAVVARFEQTLDELDRGCTRMVWANAGHPPPLVIHEGGRAELLAGARADLLLGVDPTRERVEHEVTLERGATVLLYTDGLVERRDTFLDDGLEKLRALAAELAGRTLDELCDGILEGMIDGRPEDDVALVAVRLHRQDRPRPASAGPNAVPPSVPDPVAPSG